MHLTWNSVSQNINHPTGKSHSLNWFGFCIDWDLKVHYQFANSNLVQTVDEISFSIILLTKSSLRRYLTIYFMKSYLHILANIPDKTWARSWISLIRSLMSVIPSFAFSDSDRRTGLDWSIIVHSDSWTFFSSSSQDPTGPDVGRSFMLK